MRLEGGDCQHARVAEWIEMQRFGAQCTKGRERRDWSQQDG